MRIITLIIVHCSAVRPDQQSSVAQIDTWHRKLGWKLAIGYHYVVRRYPKALIVAHHDLNPQKSCPCFDAAKEYSQL